MAATHQTGCKQISLWTDSLTLEKPQSPVKTILSFLSHMQHNNVIIEAKISCWNRVLAPTYGSKTATFGQ
jgi:hypothetical protein